MMQDVNSIFSGAVGADGQRSAQAITATALSTNVVDLRNASAPALSDTGQGSMLYLVVCVLQAFNSLTSLDVTLESDSTSNLATSPTVHVKLTAPLATLTAGAVAACSPLPAGANYERYLGGLQPDHGFGVRLPDRHATRLAGLPVQLPAGCLRSRQ
jgi:hypothetical protein